MHDRGENMCGLFAYEGDVNELDEFELTFHHLIHRGPDDHEILISQNKNASLCFHRLAIMDPTIKGHQPFLDSQTQTIIVCNGEIYNHHKLRQKLEKNYHFKSQSDCEVLIPMYRDLSLRDLCVELDAEFSLVIWDEEKKKLLAARDPIGIRPLFYGRSNSGKMIFSSEAKLLTPYCSHIQPFPPGHYYDGENFYSYYDPTKVTSNDNKDLNKILNNIKESFVEAVKKRLVSDVPIGFLLSGGLDSSLVCGVAHKILNKKISTFSVGLNQNPIDIAYAREVAQFIGSDHHEVYFSKDDAINILDKLIWHLETWDITTIRASIGMYYVCQYVHQKTSIKVLLTGEVSDELFGYKYTDFAPHSQDFQLEAEKRVRELHMYDVLRADRCISAHSLEARVPFGDLAFVKTVMAIDPELKMNKNGVGKWLLREAFKGEDLIPESILWREKAAFSDAVGHSMVDELKNYANAFYTDREFKEKSKQYTFCRPISKEALLYREIFEKHFSGHASLIKDFWMPNKTWKNCNVEDPSARVLPNYGLSGT